MWAKGKAIDPTSLGLISRARARPQPPPKASGRCGARLWLGRAARRVVDPGTGDPSAVRCAERGGGVGSPSGSHVGTNSVGARRRLRGARSASAVKSVPRHTRAHRQLGVRLAQCEPTSRLAVQVQDRVLDGPRRAGPWRGRRCRPGWELQRRPCLPDSSSACRRDDLARRANSPNVSSSPSGSSSIACSGVSDARPSDQLPEWRAPVRRAGPAPSAAVMSARLLRSRTGGRRVVCTGWKDRSTRWRRPGDKDGMYARHHCGGPEEASARAAGFREHEGSSARRQPGRHRVWPCSFLVRIGNSQDVRIHFWVTSDARAAVDRGLLSGVMGALIALLVSRRRRSRR